MDSKSIQSEKSKDQWSHIHSSSYFYEPQVNSLLKSQIAMLTDSLFLLLIPETGRRPKTEPSYEEIKGVSFSTLVGI